MAEGKRFVCDACAKEIEAWDEGDPYYRNEQGEKVYAYHPSPMRDRCSGVDSPTLCLQCGRRFKVDSAKPVHHCPKCNSKDIRDEFRLDGATCPYCKEGAFRQDPDFFATS
jgi:DNA-directed RNA polymerase subunit RPC12/RpoP